MEQAAVTLTAALHAGQAAIYNSPARFKIVAAGRRFGKSQLAAYMLIEAAMEITNYRGYTLNTEHGVYYIAPTFDLAKRVIWPKLRNIAGYAGKRSRKHPEGGLIVNENVNDGWMELVSGRRIYIKGADDPDKLRGIGLSFVVLDEYADMKPSTWDDIIEPALIDVEGKALFIGTPKGKNHFYKLFMGALEKPVDAETGDNSYWKDWEAFHFKTTDNPYLKPEEIQRQLNDPRKSKETIRQELNASFISGGSRFLSSANFPIVPAYPNVMGSIFITVDLAGFKKEERGKKMERNDESVVCVTFVDQNDWYVLEMEHGRWDVRETAQKIVLALRKYPGSRLGIEKGALANAVAPYLDDYMREFNRFVTPQPLHHNNVSKPDRILWALQGRSQRKQIYLIRGDWNEWLLDQADDFPDPLAHDDGLDALAYVDQMAVAVYVDTNELPEHEILDSLTAY